MPISRDKKIGGRNSDVCIDEATNQVITPNFYELQMLKLNFSSFPMTGYNREHSNLKPCPTPVTTTTTTTTTTSTTEEIPLPTNRRELRYFCPRER